LLESGHGSAPALLPAASRLFARHGHFHGHRARVCASTGGLCYRRGYVTSSPIHYAPVLLFVACASCAPKPAPASLTVAAAADLNFALDQVSREFRAGYPQVALEINYGSSGNFYTQLRNQAPFDIFLSADVDYPRKLAADGIGVRDSIFVYGVGRLAVWVPAASPLDPATALRSPALRHLAIANPEHAPYGRAAEAALRSMGLYATVEKKLVMGENIAQTLQFVESGAADAGIIALSLAVAPSLRGAGRYWEIPLDAYPKIEQGGIIIKASAAASAFRAFLMGDKGRLTFKEFGFYVPGK